MKATLSFSLPEEQQEFSNAVQGSSLRAAIDDIQMEVFRPARKHGYRNERIQQLVEKLDDLVANAELTDWPSFPDHGEPIDATFLIGLLETEFFQILIDRGIYHDY